MAERGSGDLTEQFAGIVECPICTDRIQNNRLLPCGHTFCLKCLEQYKKTSKVKGKSLPCPVCRRDFVIPKGGCAMFPKNIMLGQLLEVENTSKNGSDEVRQCDVCEKENIANASVHCLQCQQNLCSECEKLHRKLTASASHHVLPVSKISQFKDVVRKSYCADHPELMLELMCNDCSRAICWKCRSLSHSTHRADDMRELADGYCEQLQSNIEEMESRLSLLSKINGNINDQEKQYQENFEKQRASVTKTGQDLIRSVVANEEKLIRQLSSVLQGNLKSLQPHKQQLQAQMDSLKQQLAAAKEMKESGSPLQIVEETEQLHNKAHQLLSSNIITINEPILSAMTESEIQRHLIGSKFAPANVSSASIANTGTNATGKASPPVTYKKPQLTQSQTLPRPSHIATDSHSAASSLTNTGTDSKYRSLPPATPKKPEPPRQPQTLPVQPQRDLIRTNDADESQWYPISDEATEYSNMPPVNQPPSPLPPPHVLPRSNMLPSDRNAQSPKLPEPQQPSAKDVTTNLGYSVSSFSVGGGSAVTGVAVNKQKIYVATENNSEISVYNSDDHIFLHSLHVLGLKQASDLTFCRRNGCLYLVDWVLRSIFRVGIEGAKNTINWSTEGEFGGLSTSGDANVILAGHETNSLKEYTTLGILIRTVTLKSDVAEGIRPWHAVKLSSDLFVVSQGSSSETALHRVCLVDSEGQIIKAFGGLRGRGNNGLWGAYHLCLTEENRIFIADCNNGRIVVLDENLDFVSEITGILRKPRRICFDKTSNRLFATDNKLIAKKASDGRIVIFSQVL